MIAALLALAAGTLLSEDGMTILAGGLVRRGELHAASAIAACALGIFVGDLGLWAAGRAIGPRVLEWPRVQRHIPAAHRERFARLFRERAASLIVGSRFLPGTRLPLYLASGAFGSPFVSFALWSAVAVAIWTPVLVLAAAAGGGLVDPFSGATGDGWVARAITVLGVLAFWRAAVPLTTRRGRQRAIARVSRVWRWEFWPMWLFYAPVAAWVAALMVRHGGPGAITAANPGMPDGGLVGESKHGILTQLPRRWTIPSLLVAPGPIEWRMWDLVDHYSRHQWPLPLVMKPDVGQRGAGVKIARTLADARDYLAREQGAVLVQPYHPGPFEAGVFYYRLPGWSRGRIFSVTDKHFPAVVGDGRSTLEDLIWKDRRLRMQAHTFLARHDARRHEVLPAGRRVPLAIAGNHAQGTLFRDGRHLITPALQTRIDEIARSYRGFFIGRFDVRYRDVARFMAGDDLAIVELNGATAESTNIYDPDGSLVSAYRQLFRQWSLVFAIGAANQAAGAPASSVRRLCDLMRAHLAHRGAFQTSD